MFVQFFNEYAFHTLEVLHLLIECVGASPAFERLASLEGLRGRVEKASATLAQRMYKIVIVGYKLYPEAW